MAHKISFFIGFFILTICRNGYSQLTPSQAILQMKRGINIGNTMDAAPTETSWGNPLIQPYYFDDFKAAGFTCVRIPITWEYHVLHTSPYTIDSAWLARVDTVVSWGLQRGLIVEINAHHESWIDTHAGNTDSVARFDSIWSQVAAHFKSKSQNLLFEILNEPYPMAEDSLDLINAQILSTIRKTNPTRIVIFSGNQYSDVAQLVTAKIPSLTDTFLIGYYHSYDPWNFAGLGEGTYGSSTDISNTESLFNQVKSWSTSNKIPVILDEFAAIDTAAYNPRMFYYATIVDQALSRNIPFFAWDDNGSFQTYIRSTRKWNDAKDIICHYYPQSPKNLAVSIYQGNRVKLTWANRTTRNDSIFIDRRSDFTTFVQVGSVIATATQFIDSTFHSNDTVYYRLRTMLSDTTLYSYSITIFAKGADAFISSTEELNGQPSNFVVYPNPATSLVSIENPAHKTATLDIYNLSGRKINTLLISGDRTSISTDKLEQGTLMFIFTSGNSVQTEKVIIQ